MKQYTFTEKIQQTKVIYYELQPGDIRILIKDKKMSFDQLKSGINVYLASIRLIKSSGLLKVNQQKFNIGVRIMICDKSCSVGVAFRLYNEIVNTLKLNYPTYQRKEYSQETSTNNDI
jgi:hypothetical protein